MSGTPLQGSTKKDAKSEPPPRGAGPLMAGFAMVLIGLVSFAVSFPLIAFSGLEGVYLIIGAIVATGVGIALLLTGFYSLNRSKSRERK